MPSSASRRAASEREPRAGTASPVSPGRARDIAASTSSQNARRSGVLAGERHVRDVAARSARRAIHAPSRAVLPEPAGAEISVSGPSTPRSISSSSRCRSTTEVEPGPCSVQTCASPFAEQPGFYPARWSPEGLQRGRRERRRSRGLGLSASSLANHVPACRLDPLRAPVVGLHARAAVQRHLVDDDDVDREDRERPERVGRNRHQRRQRAEARDEDRHDAAVEVARPQREAGEQLQPRR